MACAHTVHRPPFPATEPRSFSAGAAGVATADAVVRLMLRLARLAASILSIAWRQWSSVAVVWRDQHAEAARAGGTPLWPAEALREGLGAPLLGAARAPYDRSVAAVRTALEEGTLAERWAEGRAMTLEQAIVYALERPPSSTGCWPSNAWPLAASPTSMASGRFRGCRVESMSMPLLR
jgi:hypothetical protein